jgi:hypothetical protein
MRTLPRPSSSASRIIGPMSAAERAAPLKARRNVGSLSGLVDMLLKVWVRIAYTWQSRVHPYSRMPCRDLAAPTWAPPLSQATWPLAALRRNC